MKRGEQMDEERTVIIDPRPFLADQPNDLEFYATEELTTRPPDNQKLESLMLRSMHYILHVLSQDVRFRQPGNELLEEYEVLMQGKGIHYHRCPCGCDGRK
jgi:hypothetical protein